MKKGIMIVLALVMVLSVAACSTQKKAPAGMGGGTQVQIANPFVSCKTLEEAANIAGFELTVPESVPNWVENVEIKAVADKMIEVIYTGAEQQELRVRKGSGTDDISGQYQTYDSEEKITVNDRSVTVKGNDGKINVAIWDDGTHAYSVVSEEGLTREAAENMLSHIQ